MVGGDEMKWVRSIHRVRGRGLLIEPIIKWAELRLPKKWAEFYILRYSIEWTEIEPIKFFHRTLLSRVFSKIVHKCHHYILYQLLFTTIKGSSPVRVQKAHSAGTGPDVH